jgi:enoyl-CoA hydratase
MIDSKDYSAVRVLQDGDVLRCTLNRPDELNSMSPTLHDELEELFGAISAEDDVRAVVLAAEGKCFSAGGDVRHLAEEAAANRPGRPDAIGGFSPRNAMRLIRRLLQIPQPVVAAVQGDAVGVGATIALFSDVVVMREGARIGDTHVRVGLAAGDGGAVIWPLLVGVNRAKEFLMTGRLISAAEAHALGLANHVYAPEEFDAGVDKVVADLLAVPPFALQATKAMINRDLLSRVESTLDFCLAMEALSARTDDHRAALQGFIEKRRPRFSGR